MAQFDLEMLPSCQLSHKKAKKYALYSPTALFLGFAYILMHGREEWVLVSLGSQHKSTELPVWPVFPDYLSVSYDYD